MDALKRAWRWFMDTPWGDALAVLGAAAGMAGWTGWLAFAAFLLFAHLLYVLAKRCSDAERKHAQAAEVAGWLVHHGERLGMLTVERTNTRVTEVRRVEGSDTP